MKPLNMIPVGSTVDPSSLLSEKDQVWLKGMLLRNRARFGGLRMMADDGDSGGDGDSDGDGQADDSGDDQDDGKGKDRRPKDDSARAGGDASLKADLARERRSRQKAENRLAELEKAEKDRSDADLSELQRAQKTAKEAEDRAAAAERRSLVAEVAMEKGLPAKLARRLTGSTREELEADADELLELLPKRGDSGKGDSDDDRQKKDTRPKPDRGQGGGSDTKRSGIQAGMDGYKERFARRTSGRST